MHRYASLGGAAIHLLRHRADHAVPGEPYCHPPRAERAQRPVPRRCCAVPTLSYALVCWRWRAVLLRAGAPGPGRAGVPRTPRWPGGVLLRGQLAQRRRSATPGQPPRRRTGRKARRSGSTLRAKPWLVIPWRIRIPIDATLRAFRGPRPDQAGCARRGGLALRGEAQLAERAGRAGLEPPRRIGGPPARREVEPPGRRPAGRARDRWHNRRGRDRQDRDACWPSRRSAGSVRCPYRDHRRDGSGGRPVTSLPSPRTATQPRIASMASWYGISPRVQPLSEATHGLSASRS